MADAAEPRPQQERTSVPGDEYAVLADEIRSLGEGVTDSALKVLLALEKSNPGSAYIAAKKFIDQKGLGLCDFGNFGLLGSFLPGHGNAFIASPGDIVVYAQVDRAKTGDILLVYYLDKKGLARPYHVRAVNFDMKGGIEVSDLGTAEVRWTSRERVLGKLVKVICFGDPDWHHLIGQIVDRKFLERRLKEHLKWIEENDFADKSDRLAELKRRLSILASGSK